MASGDVARQGEGEPDAGSARSRRLIDVTDADAAAAGAEAEAPADEARADDRPTPKAATTRGSRAEFVRENARLLIAVGLLVVGIVFVILGWYGAAHTNILTEQIPYLISGGLLGMALIIVAGVMAASAATERENRDLRSDLARAMSGMAPMGSNPDAAGARLAASDGKVLVVPGGRSFHQPGCPIAEGKDASALPLRKAIDEGYVTCKLCGTD
jgi:hypothetical protein